MSKENIDVSKCMYFRMNNKMPMCRACNSGVGSPYCEYHKDCYYRQLKRLEQENEELKKHQCSFENCDNFERYSTQIHELTKENEELKAKYKQCANENLDEIYELIKKNDCWRGIVNVVNEKLEKENERLKARLRPLEDSYFKGLSVIQIAELAKKSIRITAENRKLEYALQEIREELEEDITCESRECGCDDYGECLNCLKETILTKINEVIGAE